MLEIYSAAREQSTLRKVAWSAPVIVNFLIMRMSSEGPNFGHLTRKTRPHN